MNQFFDEESSSPDDDDYYMAVALIVDIEHERITKRRHGLVTYHFVVRQNKFVGHTFKFANYFANSPIYNEKKIIWRFRISRELFMHIVATFNKNQMQMASLA